MKNRMIGILGGLICGFVSTIPWIIVYHVYDRMFSLLTIPIAMGFVFGYRHLKGPMDKAVPAIISVCSIFIIVVTTLLVIPVSILINSGYPVNLYLILELYMDHEIRLIVLEDLVFSVIFTMLGIGGVINDIKHEVGRSFNKGKNTFSQGVYEGETMLVKAKFEERGAMSKETAVSYDTLSLTPAMGHTVAKLKKTYTIRKYQGLYYFSDDKRPYIIKRIAIVVIAVLIIGAILSACGYAALTFVEGYNDYMYLMR